MQHLLKALQAAAAAQSYLPQLPRDLQLIEQYLRKGDVHLEPALLRVNDQHLQILERVADAVPPLSRWTAPDRRLVRFFALRSPVLVPRPGITPNDWRDPGDDLTGRVLQTTLQDEGPQEDLYADWRSELLQQGISPERITLFTARFARPLAKDGRLTSAGRFLVALRSDQLVSLLPSMGRHYLREDFFSLLIRQHADRFAEVAQTLIRNNRMNDLPALVWQMAFESDPARFEAACFAAYGVMPDVAERFHLGRDLVKYFPRYEAEVWQIAPLALENAREPTARAAVARWMIEQRGAAAVPHIEKFIAEWSAPAITNDAYKIWMVGESKIAVIEKAARALGREARPAILAGLQQNIATLRQKCIAL